MSNRRKLPRVHVSEYARVDSVDTALATLARDGYCPDCNASANVRQFGSQLARVQIAHDATCPWLAQVVSR